MAGPQDGTVIPSINPKGVQGAAEADDGRPGGVARQGADVAAAQGGQPPAQQEDQEQKETWFAFKLLDDADEPVKGEKCKVKLPDGSEKNMRTNSSGIIMLEDVDPGKVSIRLMNRYDYEWKLSRVEDKV